MDDLWELRGVRAERRDVIGERSMKSDHSVPRRNIQLKLLSLRLRRTEAHGLSGGFESEELDARIAHSTRNNFDSFARIDSERETMGEKPSSVSCDRTVQSLPIDRIDELQCQNQFPIREHSALNDSRRGGS